MDTMATEVLGTMVTMGGLAAAVTTEAAITEALVTMATTEVLTAVVAAAIMEEAAVMEVVAVEVVSDHRSPVRWTQMKEDDEKYV